MPFVFHVLKSLLSSHSHGLVRRILAKWLSYRIHSPGLTKLGHSGYSHLFHINLGSKVNLRVCIQRLYRRHFPCALHWFFHIILPVKDIDVGLGASLVHHVDEAALLINEATLTVYGGFVGREGQLPRLRRVDAHLVVAKGTDQKLVRHIHLEGQHLAKAFRLRSDLAAGRSILAVVDVDDEKHIVRLRKSDAAMIVLV